MLPTSEAQRLTSNKGQPRSMIFMSFESQYACDFLLVLNTNYTMYRPHLSPFPKRGRFSIELLGLPPFNPEFENVPLAEILRARV